MGDLVSRKKVKSVREIKDRNVVKQSLDFSCGPAGLATIIKYYCGGDTSEKEILTELLLNTSIEKVKQRRGFSLLDLKRYAQKKGYVVTGYKMDMDFLKEIESPVLVPIKFKNYRHFVVIKDAVGGRVFFADPAMGNVTMRTDCFESIWQKGIGLVVAPPDVSGVSNKLIPEEEELRVVDHRSIKRSLENAVNRTAVFPSEF